THLDAQLLWDPIASSSCFHGITTVIPGNCALALAPCKEQDRDSILRSFERVEAISLPALRSGVPWGWTTFPQYLDRLRGNLGVNVAALMGHCALRQFVMGEAATERVATPVDIETVKLFEEIATKSGRPVIWQSIAHRWDRPNEWRQLLDLAEQSLAKGVQSYPLCNARLFNNRFTMKNAQVFDDLPTWKQILFLPVEERMKVLRDAELRKKLRYEAVEEKKSSRFSRRWDLVYMIKAATLKNKYLEKKSVTEIAQIRGQDIID